MRWVLLLVVEAAGVMVRAALVARQDRVALKPAQSAARHHCHLLLLPLYFLSICEPIF